MSGPIHPVNEKLAHVHSIEQQYLNGYQNWQKERCGVISSLFSETAYTYVTYSAMEIDCIDGCLNPHNKPSKVTHWLEVAKFMNVFWIPISCNQIFEVNKVFFTECCGSSAQEPLEGAPDPWELTFSMVTGNLAQFSTLTDTVVSIVDALEEVNSYFKSWSSWTTPISNISGFVGAVWIPIAIKGLWKDEQVIEQISQKEGHISDKRWKILCEIKTRLRWDELSQILTIVYTALGILGMCFLIWVPPLALAAWILYAASTGLLIVQLLLDEIADYCLYLEIDRIEHAK